MKFFITLLFMILNTGFFVLSAHATDEDVSMPDEAIGTWGDDDQCLAYHRSHNVFILEKNGHLYLNYNGEKALEYWFLNPRIDGEVIYLSSNLQKDERLILGIIESKSSDFYLTYWGAGESAENGVQLRKCSSQDIVRGIGYDPLKSRDKDLEKARHISFTLGYAMGAVQICKGLQMHDDTGRYITQIAMESALKFAESENKLPPEKWVQSFLPQRTIGALRIASIDKEVIPNFCDEIMKAYGTNGRVVDGLITFSDLNDSQKD